MIPIACKVCGYDPKDHVYAGIDNNLYKKRKYDRKLVKDACEEHEMLYSNHICKPVWKKCCGVFDQYRISFRDLKKIG
jgi:hypothetical protein